MYGGFVGNETDVNERQPYVNQVHLSGDLNNDDNGGGDNSENAYHVVVADNLNGLPPVLDGLFIRNGNANGAAPHHGGGAIIVLDYLSGSTAFPVVYKTAFLNNAGKFGGAIAISNQNGAMNLNHCVLANNTATVDGGAILNKGNCAISNCLFVANRATEVGGALHSLIGNVSFTNCTIVQNYAGLFGGIYAATGPIAASNNIVWGNEDDIGDNVQLFLDGNAVFYGNYNCIQSYDFDMDSSGNINSNPRFTNELGSDGIPGTSDENFRLFQQSPCIDAGDNTAVYVAVDLAGTTRILDDPYTVDTGNNPDNLSGIVDMGAYEHVAGSGGNGVLMWSGNNSYDFHDPENWLPGGSPSSDANVMFNGNPTNQGYVIFNQTTYLNSLHVTEGSFLFDLNDNYLTLRGSSQTLRIDPYRNEASVIFEGPGMIDSLFPIDLSGNIEFVNMTLDVGELTLEAGATLGFDGTLIGDVTNEGATILPAGQGIGAFTIDGNLYNQNSGNSVRELIGSIVFDIAGYTPGGTHDYLTVNASADMSTAIELRWNFVPLENDAFDLMDVGSTYGYPSLIYNRGLPTT